MSLLKPFIAWTVSSYSCHHTAKVFLTEVSALTLVLTPVSAAAVLSLVQLLCCCLVTKVSQDKSVIVDDAKKTKTTTKDYKACYYVAMTMHVLSTFLTNWSLARMEAASTLAIKLTEPMVSAIVQWMWLREGLNCHMCVSLPLVVGGALVFVSDDVTLVQQAVTSGVMLAMASNVLLAVRNVAIKGLHSGKLNVSLRWMGWNRMGMTAGVYFVIMASSSTLAIRRVLSPGTSLAVTSLLLSGAFHVTYSLISTSVILHALDVVSHAMANVIKRMLVVALLYVSGSRSASGVNAAGLAVASVGLAVYVRGKAAVKPESWRCCPVGANIKGHVYRKLTASNGRCQVLAAALISAALCLSLTSINTLRPLHLTLGYLGADDDQQSLPLTPETQSAPFGLNWPRPPHNATLLSQWAEFLSLDYTQHPFDTDRLAPTLHTNDEVVWEIQRLHVRVLTSLLGGRRHAMLMDFATYENKGDPAITGGQVALLKRLNVTIVFSCSTGRCNDDNLKKAREISNGYNSTSLIILLQGGGNLVGYSIADIIREKILNRFPDFPTLLFSQSIWLHKGNQAHLNKCREIYSHKENLTIFLRDRQSLGLAQKHFPGTKLMLMPDMAFGLGCVPRTMPPTLDIVWIKRSDNESSGYKVPEIPTNLSVYVGDWLKWKTNKGKTPMETSFLIAFNGLSFLQRGRVVITDRLHGHILSVLLGIPHVLIDNPPYFKLSSFRRSWTAGLSNTVLVTTGEEALEQAQQLLQRYESSLPSIMTYY
ncbi:hypothetical protein C0Q70_07246 [Pomacea canaliculata]|uniref:Sugar phosphate transporter domain-containing protein n=1 Tax=Pomacea canaliculata TaxID=400727 RepID=A0A2T7PEH7_POMCA|nr:uncharacterized protein LOC112562438 [Pomacea canaliculata]PVD31828.1 hypothetical protein C0Q70_07246 [Pomacea canaliculata]